MILRSVTDLISLVYPNTCPSCGLRLLRGEDTVCSICHFKLPTTGYFTDSDNPVARVFWGRTDLHRAGAAFFYQKGTRLQKLMYRLKYQQRKDIGTWLGTRLGQEMRATPFDKVDLLVPVPMHRARRRLRNYNQAAVIGEAAALELELPFQEHVLRKLHNTGSQTSRRRIDRWERVAESYQVVDPEVIRDKHVLLVDDVVTTGATAEACAMQLLKGAGKVSFCAVAAAID